MSHKHEWVLIDNYDSKPQRRPLPDGQWIPGKGGLFGSSPRYVPGFNMDDVLERVVETIKSVDEPYYTFQTWACNCGKTKTNSQRHAGIIEILKRGVS